MYFEPVNIQKKINLCMQVDQFAFRKRVRQVSKYQRSQNSHEKSLQKLQTDIEHSIQRRKARFEKKIALHYPQDLPIVKIREKLLNAINRNQVVIVCGETGSGKTTQLPKICLEAGRGIAGNIGHTQPRRLAARTVATRIAEELQSDIGSVVGFKVRFSDKVSDQTRIKLMTDGILLAEIQNDPYLDQYDTLIIDEAHERSLNIDFLLGYLKNLLSRRPNLKLVITSATIDPERFSRHFKDAPIIQVQGRAWPVEVRYRPYDQICNENNEDLDENQALLQSCEELATEGDGDILVFLPGEREIREQHDFLRKKLTFSKKLRGSEVLPLYARLSLGEQQRIFARHINRRIVLATNVAETSLTVPGIRYVIDFGLARISRYSVRSKIQSLPIEKISQASANQRKGRCGREALGICIRLFAEDEFLNRAQFTEPEIKRTNLASVILQMQAMRLGHVDNFPFVESPEQKYINDGYRLLVEIGAVDEKRHLTKLGRSLARLPVDPRFSRMLFAAKAEGCIDEVLTIVSALSVQEPRERPLVKQQAADEQHVQFNDPRSDFVSWLNLWDFITVQLNHLSNNKFRKMCKQRFLSWSRIKEWRDVRHQLVNMTTEMGLRGNNKPAGYENIHRALLTGLLANVCRKSDKREYSSTRNRKVYVFPGSGLSKSGPKWIMAAEITETSRLYARTVAMIKPQWIENLSTHLLKHSYFGEHWQRSRGQVGAYRKSSLYGLEVNPKKHINYGPIEPIESREIFIRQALVEGHFNTTAGFYKHNIALVDEIKTLEDKSRRRDILIDPQQLYYFYDALVPSGIYSTPLFEKWRLEFEKNKPKGLYYSRNMLLASSDTSSISSAQFPDQLEFADVVLPLSYRFEPDAVDDGVTLSIPATLINRVSAERCEWLVPGMLEEKLSTLLRALPKSLRKNFVPVPDFVRDCFCRMEADDKSLFLEFSNQLRRINGIDVPISAWQGISVATSMLMNFRLLGSEGQILDQGRDLKKLQKQYAPHVEKSMAQTVGNTYERENITDWNFGDLPATVEIESAGIIMQGYPALKDEKGKIALRLFADENSARQSMHYGLRALLRIVLAEEIKYMRRKLPGIQQLCLYFTPFGSCEELIDDIICAAIDQTFILERPYPVNREQYQQALSARRGDLLIIATELCDLLARIFENYRSISRRLDAALSLCWIEPAQDINEQLSALVFKGFVSQTPRNWLDRIPIYLTAIDKRLDGIDQSPDKDRKRRSEFLPLWEKFKQLPIQHEQVENYHKKRTQIRWLLEELKISIFSQSIGTTEKVSIKRLELRLLQLQGT